MLIYDREFLSVNNATGFLIGFCANLQKACIAFHTPYHLIWIALSSHTQFQDSIKNYGSKKHSSHWATTGCRRSKDFRLAFTRPRAEDTLIPPRVLPKSSARVLTCKTSHQQSLLKPAGKEFCAPFQFWVWTHTSVMSKLPLLPAIGAEDNDPSGLNDKWQVERSVSKHKSLRCIHSVACPLSFESCLRISEDPEHINIKKWKIYDMFCMNIQCIFLKHAHQDFKKDIWVIIGLISGNCIYWHQRKLQFFTKYWWHEDLWLSVFLRQAVATKNYMHSCSHSPFFFFF